MQNNPDAFKQLIVDQHPNGIASDGRAYKDIPSDELTKMVVDKFPQGVTKTGTPYSAYLPKQTQQNTLLNNPITRGIQNIFPGKQVGQAIGTLAGAGIAKAQGNYQNYDLSAPSPLQVGGDIAQGALTVAAPGVGRGEAALGRVGANVALGAGLGASNAVAQGQGIKDIAKEGAIGGAVGGGVSGGNEIASYLTENMPRWFTKLALPKLAQTKLKGAPNEVVDYAINNSKGLTLRNMYNNSGKAANSFENQIQAVLNHPNYANETGSNKIIGDVIDSLPNSQLEPDQVIKYAKQVAPTQKTLIDKVANGTANLSEKNILRKALDAATKKRFVSDTPKLTYAKDIGAKMADLLRADVKGTAKETEPIFAEYAKELNLRGALGAAISKRRMLGPLAAGVGGFAKAGIPGALEGIALEEGLRSPTAKLLAAKGINAVAPKVGAVATPLIAGGKAPLIKKLTSAREPNK